MFLTIFVALFVSVNGRDFLEPKFQVLTPDELMVEVPYYDDLKLVTFRIGVRRKNNEAEDLERGENIINNNRIFIYDERFDLKKGDVVNYLLAYRDTEGYQAQTGKYIFDGVYYKKPFGRRHRFRRGIFTTTKSPRARYFDPTEHGDEDVEDFDIEPRFGGGPRHHHHHPHHGHQWPHQPGFNPFTPPGRGPLPYPGPGGDHPVFGVGCNDHRHDVCHEQEPEKHQRNKATVTTSTTTTTTTTEFPDIDIRFGD